ncbi:MAG: hypothetical protein ACJ75J_16155 [Cytophagaceae bacterium]
MKLYLFACLLAFFTLGTLSAQDCIKDFPFQKGTLYEETSYDAKDAKTGKTVFTVTDLTTAGGKVEATVHSVHYDKNDVKGNESDFKIICEGNKLMFDVAGMMSGMQTPGPGGDKAKGMEMKMESGFIEMPRELSVGLALSDITMKMKMVDKASQTEVGTVTMLTSHRKVEAKENITTPAGTFECFKITGDVKTDTKLNMGMNIPSNTGKTVQYISKGVGMVKTMYYNSDGKLINYRILTKFKKQ